MTRSALATKATTPLKCQEFHTDALNKSMRIMNDELFAREFFYVNMRAMASSLVTKYNKLCDCELTTEEVSTITYIACWEDEWSKLRAFKGETTLEAWVAKLGSQATYKFLVEEKYIDGFGNTKTNDYRLTVRGIEDDALRQAIVDMVFIPEQHKVLEMYYVNKYDDETLAIVFGNIEKAKTVLKTAEKTLIEQLLNTENPYAEMALSSKKIINPEMPFQSWHDRIDEGDVCDNLQVLRDLLTRLYNNEDWDSNAERFINSVVDEMDWNDVQKEVWRERFFNETPSKVLAIRFHVRNTWIDNTYSRLNKQFRIAVKTWWNNNN